MTVLNYDEETDVTICECDECGSHYDIDDGYNEDFCCGSCSDEYHGYNEPTVVHGYHAVNVVHEKGWGEQERSLYGGKYYIGVELEFHTHDEEESGRGIYDLVDDWGILMHDGSIGLEIISRPCDFKELEMNFGMLFDAKLKSNHGLTVRSNAGLHINISRTAFRSDNALANFVLFINNHPEASERIAGRGQNTWGEWARLQHHTKKEADDKAKNGSEKYQAVRIGNDRIEVRIFKSTSVLKTFLSRVRFCMALIDYCNRVDATGLYPTMSSFIQFTKGTNHIKYIMADYISKNVVDDAPQLGEDDIYDYEQDVYRSYATPWLNTSY